MHSKNGISFIWTRRETQIVFHHKVKYDQTLEPYANDDIYSWKLMFYFHYKTKSHAAVAMIANTISYLPSYISYICCRYPMSEMSHNKK